MIAKMKSLCASGSQDHFSRLAPSPTPHQPPSARAYLPWMDWKHVPSWSGQEPLSHASIRAIRLAEVTARISASAVMTAAAPRKIRAGAPAEKSRAASTSSNTRPVPRSRPARTRPTTMTPTGRTTGTITCDQVVSDERLRHSTVAAQTMSAILAASDGCSRCPASAIQLRLP